jgi:hypothetical protein
MFSGGRRKSQYFSNTKVRVGWRWGCCCYGLMLVGGVGVVFVVVAVVVVLLLSWCCCRRGVVFVGCVDSLSRLTGQY